jgi:hypothetical protein
LIQIVPAFTRCCENELQWDGSGNFAGGVRVVLVVFGGDVSGAEEDRTHDLRIANVKI